MGQYISGTSVWVRYFWCHQKPQSKNWIGSYRWEYLVSETLTLSMVLSNKLSPCCQNATQLCLQVWLPHRMLIARQKFEKSWYCVIVCSLLSSVSSFKRYPYSISIFQPEPQEACKSICDVCLSWNLDVEMNGSSIRISISYQTDFPNARHMLNVPTQTRNVQYICKSKLALFLQAFLTYMKVLPRERHLHMFCNVISQKPVGLSRILPWTVVTCQGSELHYVCSQFWSEFDEMRT